MTTIKMKKKITITIITSFVGILLTIGVVIFTVPNLKEKIVFYMAGISYIDKGDGITNYQKYGCGPSALKIFLDKLNISVPIEEIAQLSETNKGVTTMLGLKKAASSKGVEMLGVRTTYDFLKQQKTLAIVYIEDNHFAVFESVDNKGNVILLDPAAGRIKMSKKSFCKVWKGIALIINEQHFEKLSIPKNH
ncbi:MAG: cysteine peptidase family C39 domain-containing protein [bacterium]|nr:cysteine peptidase family C39 domain-containing protein [bacterium]